jgi:DNA primase
LQFWLERALDHFDPREPESRARALKSVGARLAKVDDDLARGEYARFVADRLGIDMETVEQAIGRRSRPRRSGGSARSSDPRPGSTPRRRAEEELLRTLLSDAGLVRGSGVDVEWFGDIDTSEAFDALTRLAVGVSDGQAVPLPPADDPTSDLLTRLTMSRAPVTPIADCRLAVRRSSLEERIDRLETELASIDPGLQTSSPILQELLRLQSERRRLEGGAT